MRLHNLKLAKINAIKALTGQELYREEPDLPPLPYLPIFIPKEKMKEMVREALKNPETPKPQNPKTPFIINKIENFKIV